MIEDPKLLVRKLHKLEEANRKSNSSSQKLEEELQIVKKQLKVKLEQESLLRQELSKIKQNYNSLESSHQSLNSDHLLLLTKLQQKKLKRQQLTKSLHSLSLQLSQQSLQSRNLYSESLIKSLTDENSALKHQIAEIDAASELSLRSLKMLNEDLSSQLQLSKSSEASLKGSLEKAQKDFKEKEKILKDFEEKFRATEERLKLFCTAVRYKEDEIMVEKVKNQELEAKESVLQIAVKNFQQEVKSLRHEKEEEVIKRRREDMLSRSSGFHSP